MKNEWLLLTALLLSCEAKTETPRAAKQAATSAPSASVAMTPVSPTAWGAQQALDRLDARAPVPLLPMMANHQKQNMREHLSAVQAIVAGVAKNDFAAVEKAAGGIGFSEQMGQMCEHMGAGAPGFSETALRFHHDADKIGEAARKRDSQQVLARLGETLSQCTACHEAYKQHVVDETEWSSSGGTAPPRHHMD